MRPNPIARPSDHVMEFEAMSAPVFHLNPMGRLANLMIAYMVALKFRHMVSDCRISNITIPEWNIHHPPIDSPGPVAVERREQYIDLTTLADQTWSGRIRRVEWTGFGQRMENFLSPAQYQNVFASLFTEPMGYGSAYLVCPIRAEDILNGPHPDYVLTPVEFYRDIADMTGLTPVFIGQTDPNPYMDRLRTALPNAIIRPHNPDPLVEFETIRQSRNLVIGVSTFNWLAAWLSHSAENIYLAVSGLYNPMQNPEVDLLPIGDERYKFFLFPLNYAVPLDQHAEVHRRIAPYWREMSHEALRQQFATAPRFARALKQALALFDEDYYLNEHPDVAAVAQRLGRTFARDHYVNYGFREGRPSMRFDAAWYANQYPFAGFEVAQGDYADCAHHYIAIGKARGYLPYAPANEA